MKMNKIEYYKAATEFEINKDRTETISKIYNESLPVELQHIVSYAGVVDFFDEERRAISYEEMKDPAYQMEFDFVKKGYLPVVDVYDNTFIVYVFKYRHWAKYNSVDDMIYKEGQSLDELL